MEEGQGPMRRCKSRVKKLAKCSTGIPIAPAGAGAAVQCKRIYAPCGDEGLRGDATRSVAPQGESNPWR